MKTINRISIILIALVLPFAVWSQDRDSSGLGFGMEDLHWLAGTWQVQGQTVFESWKVEDDGKLQGKGYQEEDNKTRHLESLEIAMKDGDIVYTATVTNQNMGFPIPFTCLGYSNQDLLFVNRDHDFPSQIQYTLVDDDKILIRLYKNMEGVMVQQMAYHMVRK